MADPESLVLPEMFEPGQEARGPSLDLPEMFKPPAEAQPPPDPMGEPFRPELVVDEIAEARRIVAHQGEEFLRMGYEEVVKPQLRKLRPTIRPGEIAKRGAAGVTQGVLGTAEMIPTLLAISPFGPSTRPVTGVPNIPPNYLAGKVMPERFLEEAPYAAERFVQAGGLGLGATAPLLPAAGPLGGLWAREAMLGFNFGVAGEATHELGLGRLTGEVGLALVAPAVGLIRGGKRMVKLALDPVRKLTWKRVREIFRGTARQPISEQQVAAAEEIIRRGESVAPGVRVTAGQALAEAGRPELLNLEAAVANVFVDAQGRVLRTAEVNEQALAGALKRLVEEIPEGTPPAERVTRLRDMTEAVVNREIEIAKANVDARAAELGIGADPIARARLLSRELTELDELNTKAVGKAIGDLMKREGGELFVDTTPLKEAAELLLHGRTAAERAAKPATVNPLVTLGKRGLIDPEIQARLTALSKRVLESIPEPGPGQVGAISGEAAGKIAQARELAESVRTPRTSLDEIISYRQQLLRAKRMVLNNPKAELRDVFGLQEMLDATDALLDNPRLVDAATGRQIMELSRPDPAFAAVGRYRDLADEYRQLIQRYRQSASGTVLRVARAARGGDEPLSQIPRIFLRRNTAKGAPEAAASFQRALGQNAEARRAVASHAVDEMMRGTQGARVASARMERWMEQHSQALDRMPWLKDELDEVVRLQRGVEGVTSGGLSKVRALDRKIARLSLDDRPDVVARRILDDPNPAATTGEILDVLGQNEQAKRGLARAVWEEVEHRALKYVQGPRGFKELDLEAIRRDLLGARSALSMLTSPEHLDNLFQLLDIGTVARQTGEARRVPVLVRRMMQEPRSFFNVIRFTSRLRSVFLRQQGEVVTIVESIARTLEGTRGRVNRESVFQLIEEAKSSPRLAADLLGMVRNPTPEAKRRLLFWMAQLRIEKPKRRKHEPLGPPRPAQLPAGPPGISLRPGA